MDRRDKRLANLPVSGSVPGTAGSQRRRESDGAVRTEVDRGAPQARRGLLFVQLDDADVARVAVRREETGDR